MRSVIIFLAGFIAGMLSLLALLWSSGSLHAVSAAAPVSATPAASAPSVPNPPALTTSAGDSGEVPPLILPVQGADATRIVDTFADARGGGSPHEALDIMARRGSPVLAAGDGAIEKLFESKKGGTTIYQFDPSRTWCYYYAHLDHYAAGLIQGATVHQGQVIGYVGSTGDASPTAPHLHFAIFKLGPEKHWWRGTAVNPFPILMRHARK
jgi:murein DD-endopeptidase MepM/ murein hydrolase activator NlpD